MKTSSGGADLNILKHLYILYFLGKFLKQILSIKGVFEYVRFLQSIYLQILWCKFG